MRRGGKFGTKKAICNHGHTHDSGTEAKRCDELHFLQQSGHITNLKVHPKYLFYIGGVALKMGNGQQARYTADFSYFEGDKSVTEDVKSKSKLVDGRDWPLRKALFKALFPYIELREVRR